MNRVTFTVIGYILILLGFLSLILSMIGLGLTPLKFIDNILGPLGSFIAKLLMIVVGMIMFYMSRVPADEDDV